jgi:hypothetical protein
VHRPVDIGEVIQRSISAFGAQAGLVIPAALIVFVPLAALEALVGADDSPGLGVLSFAASLIGGFWFQGMVVEAVRDIQDGRRDFTLGELFRAPAPVLGALILAGVLAVLGILLGFVLFIVPGLLLLTWWSVVIPVVVVERPGLGAAFGRSRELVRGHGWQVFGLLIVVLVMVILLSAVLAVIAYLLSDTATGSAIASLISNVTIVPFFSITMATLYFALRDAHGEAPVPALGERSYGPGGGFAPPQAPASERPDIGLD